MKFKNILKILYNTPAPLKNIHPKIKKKFYFGADKKRKIAKRKKKKKSKLKLFSQLHNLRLHFVPTVAHLSGDSVR